jgi:hypothetical protein
VRKILFSRFDALVRGARVSDAFARLFSGQKLEDFKLAQAESAARFALRHNGQKRRTAYLARLERSPPPSRRWSPNAPSATSSSAP